MAMAEAKGQKNRPWMDKFLDRSALLAGSMLATGLAGTPAPANASIASITPGPAPTEQAAPNLPAPQAAPVSDTDTPPPGINKEQWGAVRRMSDPNEYDDRVISYIHSKCISGQEPQEDEDSVTGRGSAPYECVEAAKREIENGAFRKRWSDKLSHIDGGDPAVAPFMPSRVKQNADAGQLVVAVNKEGSRGIYITPEIAVDSASAIALVDKAPPASVVKDLKKSGLSIADVAAITNSCLDRRTEAAHLTRLPKRLAECSAAAYDFAKWEQYLRAGEKVPQNDQGRGD